jgi:DNA-directed RNA polymerase specialized sigma24 family protein
MPNLLTYGIYLDAREGVPVEDIAEICGLSLEYVEERLGAARLCFDKQVHHIEFAQNW